MWSLPAQYHQSGRTAVIVDGLNHLIWRNDADQVARFFRHLRDSAKVYPVFSVFHADVVESNSQLAEAIVLLRDQASTWIDIVPPSPWTVAKHPAVLFGAHLMHKRSSGKITKTVRT